MKNVDKNLIIENSKIIVIEGDITSLKVDAYVNAANNYMLGGGGVDYAIHKAAGEKELIDYNQKYNGGYLKTGEAKISPGFKAKAKYIIHTVGPIYYEHDEKENEKLLTDSYYNSLEVAKLNNIHSIAFPSISQGVYGYPVKEATKISLTAIKKWINENKSYQIDIYLVSFLRDGYLEYLEAINNL